MKINILGTEYEIIYDKNKDNPKLKDANGYCENYTKKLVVDDFEPDKITVEEPSQFKSKVLRHEIVHAFLHESGLDYVSGWARNEEMVDWIALQIDKMYKAMKEANCI